MHGPIRHGRGFTIVELVVITLLLAILVAVALPRLLSAQSQARLAVLEDVAGVVKTATHLVHSQALLEDKTAVGTVDTIVLEGINVQINSGFPRGHWNRALRYITRIDMPFTPLGQVCDERLCGVGNRTSIPGVSSATGGRGGVVFPSGYRWNDLCSVYYYNRQDGSYPLIGVLNTGC